MIKQGLFQAKAAEPDPADAAAVAAAAAATEAAAVAAADIAVARADDPDEVAAAAAAAADTAAAASSPPAAGALAIAVEPHLADLVEGEAPINANHIDLAKVQMLVLTFVALFAYAVTLSEMFRAVPAPDATRPFTEFPVINGNLVVILLLSHGGYLIQKQVATPRG